MRGQLDHPVPATPPSQAALPSAAFSGFADHWLKVAIAPKRKGRTWLLYEYICRIWLVPFFRDRELSTITPMDVEALQAHVATADHSKTTGRKRRPGPKTNNEVIGCLSSMLGTAVRWRYLTANPCDGVSRLGVPPPPLDFYDAVQTAAWLATCEHVAPDWHAFFFVAFRTGLREGELFALRVEDLDLASGRANVLRSYGLVGRSQYGESSPKSGKARTVGLTPSTVAVLRHHLGARSSGLVFAASRADGDRHLLRQMLLAPWNRVTKAAKLKPMTLHGMRHSYASQLVMAGVPLPVVQALLGHSTIRMTERYAHLGPGHASSFVGVLDTVLDTSTVVVPKMATSTGKKMVVVVGTGSNFRRRAGSGGEGADGTVQRPLRRRAPPLCAGGAASAVNVSLSRSRRPASSPPWGNWASAMENRSGLARVSRAHPATND